MLELLHACASLITNVPCISRTGEGNMSEFTTTIYEAGIATGVGCATQKSWAARYNEQTEVCIPPISVFAWIILTGLRN